MDYSVSSLLWDPQQIRNYSKINGFYHHFTCVEALEYEEFEIWLRPRSFDQWMDCRYKCLRSPLKKYPITWMVSTLGKNKNWILDPVTQNVHSYKTNKIQTKSTDCSMSYCLTTRKTGIWSMAQRGIWKHYWKSTHSVAQRPDTGVGCRLYRHIR